VLAVALDRQHADGPEDRLGQTFAARGAGSIMAAGGGRSSSAADTARLSRIAWIATGSSMVPSKRRRPPQADGTTFTQIATVGANVTSHKDSKVTKGTFYRVRAINSAGTSGYSNTVKVK
jgi:hypothetical protein